MNPLSVKNRSKLRIDASFIMFFGCGLCIIYSLSSSMKMTLDPDVFPLLYTANPNVPNNRTNSSHVKSLGCSLNRSISFSFVLIAMKFRLQRYTFYQSKPKCFFTTPSLSRHQSITSTSLSSRRGEGAKSLTVLRSYTSYGLLSGERKPIKKIKAPLAR